MAVSIRPADCQSESGAMIELLQRNLPHRCHGKIFPWLYFENPEGAARAWLAFDSDTNRMVGMAAAFPRRFRQSGSEARGYVLGDFCIDSANRSLGVALLLQRACLDALSEDSASLAFDFPSRNMMAVYQRLHIGPQEEMIRYIKPLRVDRNVHARVSTPAAARALTALGNAALRLRDRGHEHPQGWQIRLEPWPWGEEFGGVAAEWGPGSGACVLRTAPYLNWRYGQHPLQPHEMMAVREGERLLGYLVQHTNGASCIVDDLVTGDPEAGAALLEHATVLARERGLDNLCAPWLSKHAGRLLLAQCGFHPRESSPVILLPLPWRRQAPESTSTWRLTAGDWES